MNIPKGKDQQLDDLSLVEDGVNIPFNFQPAKVKGNFTFHPPTQVNVIGGYGLCDGDACLRRPIKVDLLLVMPKECMQERDFLNQRYLRKRALYLAHVAIAISKLHHDTKFAYHNEEPLKPIIHVSIKLKDKKEQVEVMIHVAPDSFKSFHPDTKRFLPSSCNVRKDWFLQQHNNKLQGEDQEQELIATPHYNSVVMSDILMETHLDHLQQFSLEFEGLGEAVKMVKVWLRQRKLDQGYSSFNGFMATMLLSYLSQKSKIRSGMSILQIFRAFLVSLAESDWSVKGISFVDDNEAIGDFHMHFPVVFVAPSGNFNLCYALTADAYYQLKYEAQMSLDLIKKRSGFDSIFIKTTSFAHKYDQVIHFPHAQSMRKVVAKVGASLVDQGGNCIPQALVVILSIMKKALLRRVQHYGIQYHAYNKWAISEKPPSWCQVGNFISIGLIYDQFHYSRVIDKGPQADSQQAKAWREFWGELSHIHRFKDASILEAVYWECANVCEKREIVTKICTHVLKRHCDLPKFAMKLSTNVLEQFIRLKSQTTSDGSRVACEGCGDERNVDIVTSYNKLCAMLRNIDLSLSVTNLQGISPVLRYTEVFMPSIVSYGRNLQLSEYEGVDGKKEKIQVVVPNKPVPTYVHPIRVVCNMEGCGKWPSEVEAIKRIKAAFYIEIAREMGRKHKNVKCLVGVDHIDVIMDGLVFRLLISYHREVELMKMHKTEDGMLKIRSTPQSNKLEYRTQYLPLLASKLHGLQSKHESFGRSCRLAKLWLSAHMMSNHVSDEACDIMMAHVYTNAGQYTAPHNSTTAFLRFLTLLASTDFNKQPLIVDFSGNMTSDDYESMEKSFAKNRAALPSMCLFTCGDRTRSLATFDKPSRVVVRRMKKLATNTSQSLQSLVMTSQPHDDDVKNIFATYNSSSVFDAVIKLKPAWITRKHEHKQQQSGSNSSGSGEVVYQQPHHFPVVDFDPVALYLNKLEENFHKFAIFFYNKLGHPEIGVLWKPDCGAKETFQVKKSFGYGRPDKEGNFSLDFVGAVLGQFADLGGGLVDTVELTR